MPDGGAAPRRTWPGRVRGFLTSRPSWVWQALAALAGLALFAWTWWQLPPALYRHVGGDARVKAITDTRTALLAGLVGLGAIGTFWLNSRVYKITTRTFELTEQGHITERYTKAIEQLGSAQLDVRLGGVYALERIAVDSTRDHPTVVEVLGAYVRQHTDPTQRRRRPPPVAVHDKTPPRPAVDVQAAVSVLGRLPSRPGVSRADLTSAHLPGALLAGANLLDARFVGVNLANAGLDGANLTGARLNGANLTRAELNGANLNGAELAEADLTDARLNGANLNGTGLGGANLTRAELNGANLTAWLGGANLTGAGFGGANLTGTWLGGADLTGAWLHGANLTGAWLDEANLTRAELNGAELATVKNLTQQQLDSAQGDDETKLPAGLQRPAHWSAAGGTAIGSAD